MYAAAAAVQLVLAAYFFGCALYGLLHGPWWTVVVFLATALFFIRQSVLLGLAYRKDRP